MRILIILFLLIANPSYASVKSVGVSSVGTGLETGKVRKLLPFGDSITAGVGGDEDEDAGNDWGYRKKLQDIIGIGTYDFVGSVSRPSSDATYDVNNWGNSGEAMNNDILGKSKSELNTSFSNAGAGSVVLFHGGTNDIILQSIDHAQKRTNDLIIADINAVINNILSIQPDAIVYVGLVVPLRQSNQATWWGTFHDDLSAAMTTRRATNPNVHTVDMYNAFLLDYTGDCEGDWYNVCMNVFSGAHPSATGYLVMAKMWARCMNDNTAIGCDGN